MYHVQPMFWVCNAIIWGSILWALYRAETKEK